MRIPNWSDEYEFVTPEIQQFIKANQGKLLKDADSDLYQKSVSQMDGLVELLESLGVVIHRAEPLTSDEEDFLVNFKAGVQQCFTRDPLLIIGHNVIETSMREFERRKERFVSMVAATYVTETPELLQTRISTYGDLLANSQDKQRSEIALEAIGRRCLPKLAPLLESADDEVRLRAARCALSLGDDRALAVLRTLAMDKTSRHRLEALATVVTAGRRNDATVLARHLLRDSDTSVVLAAYEHLREMDDVAVRQEFVGRSFYLEHVAQTEHQAIFVARSGDPRIVIFGPALRCRDNVFLESPNGLVMVNSRAGQDYATLTRRVPNRTDVIGPIQCPLTPSDIVRALGGEPGARGGGPVGLGTPYTDIASVLEQMCAKGAVAAQFWPGPGPKIGLLVKK